MASNPAMLVRIAANMAEFKRNLAEGKNQIETTSAAMQKLATSFQGDKLIQAAHNVAAAVNQIGGASKLTDVEQARVNATVTKALEKYAALGQLAPAALRQLAEETRKVEAPTESLSTKMVALGSFIGTMAANAAMALGRLAIQGLKSVWDTAIGMNASLETSTLQFTTLMGDADQAKDHVKGLFDFAAKTPFETGPIIEASKQLQVFGGQALNTKENLTLIGDAAAATNAPIDELGRWTGRLYASLQAGKPFGEAAQRLGELAVMGPQSRAQLEAMQKAGKSADEIFNAFRDDLGKFSGAMAAQAGTWQGLTSSFSDAVAMLSAKALKPLFEMAKQVLGSLNEMFASDSFQQGAAEVATTIADSVVSAFKMFRSAVQFARDAWASFAESSTWVAVTAAVGAVVDVFMLWIKWNLLVSGAIVTVLDKLGILDLAMGALRLVGDGLSTMWGAFTGAIRLVSDAVSWAAQKVSEFLGYLEQIGAIDPRLPQVESAFAGLADRGIKPASEATALLDRQLEALKTPMAAVTVLTEKQEKAMKKAAEEAKKFREAAHQIISPMSLLGFGVLPTVSDGAGKVAAAFFESEKALTGLPQQFGAVAVGVNALSRELTPLPGTIGDIIAAMPRVPVAIAEAVSNSRVAWEGLKDGLTQVLHGIPQTLANAFTGGGDIMGAIKSIASQIGALVGGSIGEAIGGPMGHQIGAALGSLAGPVIDGLRKVFEATKGWILGPGGAILNWFLGKSENKKVNDMRDAFIAAAGGLHALNVKANEAGITLDKLLAAKKVKDFEAAVAELEARMGAWAAIQEEAQARLKEATDRYKFTIEELGPAMQRQQLHEMSAQLFTDWGLLTASGISVENVANRMSDATNEYLRIALATGQEVPASMRPMLESMLQMGLLTDASGTKLESLEGLTFAETLTQGFDRVVSKLDEMIKALGFGVPAAAEQAATSIVDRFRNIEIQIPIEFSLGDVPDMPSFSPSGVQGFASGTGGRFIDFGRGTPVVLHNRERIVTEREGRAEAMSTAALERELQEIKRLMKAQPRQIAVAVSDAVVLAARA